MKRAPVIAATLLAATTLSAAPLKFESGDVPANLVELFTSEGCSSCPPAEAWLSRLKGSPDLWKRIVPVAFHVDYWNSLGWADRFSSPDFTARQRRYATAWGSDSVYTPGFVVNGREWRDWYRHANLPDPSPIKVGRLEVTIDGRTAEVFFYPSTTPAQPLRVELTLLGSDIESHVSRGENSGRKLRHDFTVLHLLSAPLRPSKEGFEATLNLPAPSGAFPVAAVAAWVPAGEAQPPIQATGGWLGGG